MAGKRKMSQDRDRGGNLKQGDLSENRDPSMQQGQKDLDQRDDVGRKVPLNEDDR